MADEAAVQEAPVQTDAQPPKQKLWKSLNESGFYTKSYDEFDKQFSSPDKINKLYGTLNDAGYYTKTSDDFNKQFFTPEKKNPIGNEPKTDWKNLLQKQDEFSPNTPNGGQTGQNGNKYPSPHANPQDANAWKQLFDESLANQKKLTPQEREQQDPIKTWAKNQAIKGKKEVADYDKLPLSEKVKSVSNSIVSGGADILKGGIRGASTIEQWIFNPDDPKGKQVRQNIADAAKDINNNYIDKGADAISFNISDKDKKLMNTYGVTGAVNGFANFLPAMATAERTGGASLFFNDYEKGYEQIDKLDPKLPEGQKQLYATLRGTASALIMSHGLSSAISAGGEKAEQSVIDEVSKKAIVDLAESGADLTPENVKSALTKHIGDRALQYAENSVKGLPKSVGTMVGLEGVNIGIEKLINTTSGQKIFKQDDIPERLENAFITGLGLHLAGSLVGASSLLSKDSGARNDVAESIYHNPSDENVQNIKEGLTAHLQENGFTDEDIDHTHNVVDQIHEVVKDMPKGIKPENVVPHVEKTLTGRKLFEQQKSALSDRITELNESIKNNDVKPKVTPGDSAEKEVVGEKLQKEHDELSNQLKKVISEHYEQRAAPIEPAESGEKPAEVPIEKPTADATVKEDKPDDKPDEIGGDINKPKEEISNEIDKKAEELGKVDTTPKKLKEQKKDIINQMQEVHGLLNGDTDKEAIKRVKDAGYEVSDDGKVTFDVKDDGVFKIHHDSLVTDDAIKQVKKEFPERLDDKEPVKQLKNQKIGKPGTGTDIDPELVKENIEAAKKAGNKKMQAFFEGELARIEKETGKTKPAEQSVAADEVNTPVEEEKPVEPSKKDENNPNKTSLEKERTDINEKLVDSDKSGAQYIPYSEKLKLQRRLAEIDKQLNPEKVTAKSGAVPLPFMNEFIEHDIKPLVQKIASDTKEALSAIIKHISPKIGVDTKDLDTVTTNLNKRNEEAANIDKLVNGYEKLFDKMKDPERVDFIDRIKRGLKQPTSELQEIADAYKQMDKDLYEQVNAIKGNVAFKEDHFRVLWKKIPGTEKTKSWFGKAKAPLEGSKSFLKKATLVDMSEGIEKGGDPVSTNPFTLFKLAHADAMKFITAHRMFDALKQDGVVKFYKNKGDAPENFVPIKDKIANVYFPVKTEQGGTIIHKAGEWYIEKNAGRIINNLLSEDKIRNTAVGNGLMAIKNATTMIELSLSPYHATAMSLEAMSSDVARGLRKAVNLGLRGDLKSAGQGILDILKAPFSPKSTFSLGRNYIKLTSEKDFEKSNFGKAFLEKNPLAKEYIHDMFMGGGLTKQDNTYKTNSFQALKDNMAKDNYIGAAIRAIPALNEMIMSPLFDTYIPTLKVGMFMKEFPLTLQENTSRLESDKVTREELARKTVDFIDDRLGEMNFDNLFWDRSFKTATQLFFRSVTWKLGNARAIGGALPEQGMELYNAAKEGRAPILQPKVAWVLGLAAVHSTISSLIQYGFTGTYPQNIKDLMYPRISNDDDKKRLALPDYGKDVSSIAYRGVGEYIKSSLAGDFGKLYDIWNNKDFQGYNIIDPKDGVFEQGKDALKYMMPQPIGVQQVKKDIKNKETLPSAATHFIGFSPAPKYTTNTNIENKIYDLYNSHEGIKSKGQKETRGLKDEIRDLYKSGKIPEGEKKIEEGLLSGKLKISDIKYMVDGGNRGTSPDQYFFTQLPDDDKVWLFNQMSDAEKEKYDPKGKVRILAEKEAEAEKSKKSKPYSSFEK